MPSSTSNSEPATQSPALAVRTLLLGLLWLSAGVVLAQLSIHLMERADGWVGSKRPRTTVAQIPRVARAPNPVVAIGSSQTWRGFSPESFDAAAQRFGVQTTAYNLSWDGMSSETEWLLARRVREGFDEAGTRAQAVILELNPFFMTQTFRGQGWDTVPSAMLSTPSTLATLSRIAPRRVGELLLSRYARPTGADRFFERKLFSNVYLWETDPIDPAWNLPWPKERIELALQVGKLTRAIYPNGQEWEVQTRGLRKLVFPHTRDVVTRFYAMSTSQSFENNLEERVWCCDILKLKLDPYLVDRFFAAVDEAQRMTSNLKVVLYPVPKEYVSYPEERLAAIREQLAARGIPLIDMTREAAFKLADFTDVTHLSNDGADKFSALLAQQVLATGPNGALSSDGR